MSIHLKVPKTLLKLRPPGSCERASVCFIIAYKSSNEINRRNSNSTIKEKENYGYPCPHHHNSSLQSHLKHLERMLRVLRVLEESESPRRAATQRHAHKLPRAHGPPAAVLQCERSPVCSVRYRRLALVGVNPQHLESGPLFGVILQRLKERNCS